MGIQYNQSQNPFGQKVERPNFFGKLMNYGLGVGKLWAVLRRALRGTQQALWMRESKPWG